MTVSVGGSGVANPIIAAARTSTPPPGLSDREYTRDALGEALQEIENYLQEVAARASDLAIRFSAGRAKVRKHLADERRRIREEQPEVAAEFDRTEAQREKRNKVEQS